jgi:hypothetical protein
VSQEENRALDDHVALVGEVRRLLPHVEAVAARLIAAFEAGGRV